MVQSVWSRLQQPLFHFGIVALIKVGNVFNQLSLCKPSGFSCNWKQSEIVVAHKGNREKEKGGRALSDVFYMAALESPGLDFGLTTISSSASFEVEATGA